MPPTARPGGLTLRTRDPDRLLAFYRDLVGLPPPASGGGEVCTVGIRGSGGDSPAAVDLVEAPDAPLRPSGTVGLYHFALLHPSRSSLAHAVTRILDSGWNGIEGAADHGVSEAFYLRDPEGNGVELYRDRDPSRWPRSGDEVAMTTDPLDLEDLLAAAGETGSRETPVLGHLHLHTADLERTRSFYVEALGLRVRQSTYPGAVFLAAGDYHHHLGLNVWAGSRRAPEGATGLLRYRWMVSDDARAELQGHLDARGVGYRAGDGALLVEDPDGVEVLVGQEGSPTGTFPGSGPGTRAGDGGGPSPSPDAPAPG